MPTLEQDSQKKLRYSDAGVNIDIGNQLVEHIKHSATTTHGVGVMGDVGGFGALFDLASLNYKDPVLVSTTDGVGTKLKLAIEMEANDTIGIDLVAMCVNDLIVQGAKPLFFLDYFSCGKLDLDQASHVIDGIVKGCKLANCALIGGETAEMPSMYCNGEYDLAGFCVGAVERDAIIDGHTVQAGDSLIGVASNGAHANGYSLIRKVLEHTRTDINTKLDGNKTLAKLLIEPTKIYVESISRLFQICSVKALSHITGGGLIENVPRSIPKHLQVVIDTQSWSMPIIFKWLQIQGNIELKEMRRTFNCGVGMVVCIADKDTEKAIKSLEESGEFAWKIGQVTDKGSNDHGISFA